MWLQLLSCTNRPHAALKNDQWATLQQALNQTGEDTMEIHERLIKTHQSAQIHLESRDESYVRNDTHFKVREQKKATIVQ